VRCDFVGVRIDADLLRALSTMAPNDAALDEVVRRRAWLASVLLLRSSVASRSVAEAIARLLALASGDELAALDRAARSSAVLRSISLDGVDFAPILVDDARSHLADVSAGPLAVLSMVRNGRTREAAARALASMAAPLATLALIVRCDDTVPAIASLAADEIERRTTPERALDFIAALDLVESSTSSTSARRAGARVTSAGDRARRAIRALFLLDDERCRAALSSGVRAPRPSIRSACARFLVDASSSDAARFALTTALDDEILARRVWAANEIVRTTTSPAVVRELIPRLIHDRAPGVRVRAAMAAGRIGDFDSLELLALDASAAVRVVARRISGRAGGDGERERAKSILRDSTSSTASILGALGALAEIGRADDFGSIAPFLHDDRRRVETEAVRALVGSHASAGLDAFVDVLHDKLTSSSTATALEAARGLALVTPSLCDAKLIRKTLDATPGPRRLRVALETLLA
jgi:hypothetical protein